MRACGIVILILVAAGSPAMAADTVSAARTVVGDVVHVLSSPLRMSSSDALRVGGLLVVTGGLMAVDEDLQAAANRNAEEFPLKPALEVGRFLDPIGYGRMNVYYLGGFGLSYATGWDAGTAMFGQIMESFAVYGLLKIPLQSLVGRERPSAGAGAGSFGRRDSTSFPSGHTINVFQLATVVSHHVDRTWFTAAAYGAATCVGLQRIEADAHWASDVFLSAAMGVAISRAIIGRWEARRLSVVPTGDGVAVAWRF